MNILAFDTAFDACSVAAGRGLRSLSPSIAALTEPMATGHAERLLPMIEEILAETGMDIGDLDRIAVTRGPGTFTGTRITIAAARALALYASTPIVSVTSLQLMAMNMAANATGADEVAIATDARRGEVYFERFDPHSLVSRAPAEVLTVAEAAMRLAPSSSVVAGSGAEAIVIAAHATGKNARAVAPNLLPDALDMLFVAMELPYFNTVQPLYLRPPDAKPQIAAALVRNPA
jgi:tRNA threonylcarbamoyladenosine biosynthesis protein TsaB